MTYQDAMTIFSTVMVTFGGATLIVVALVKWLGGVWASRILEKEKGQIIREIEHVKRDALKEIEQEKSRLLKTQTFFNARVNASKEIVGVSRKILPKLSNPEMDWYEAREAIGDNIDEVRALLLAFESDYAHVLIKEDFDQLREAISQCEYINFEFDNRGINLSELGHKHVDSIYDAITAIRESLIRQIHFEAYSIQQPADAS
jgi:hypothetical protein